jgi:hypothetical protein
MQQSTIGVKESTVVYINIANRARIKQQDENNQSTISIIQHAGARTLVHCRSPDAITEVLLGKIPYTRRGSLAWSPWWGCTTIYVDILWSGPSRFLEIKPVGELHMNTTQRVYQEQKKTSRNSLSSFRLDRNIGIIHRNNCTAGWSWGFKLSQSLRRRTFNDSDTGCFSFTLFLATRLSAQRVRLDQTNRSPFSLSCLTLLSTSLHPNCKHDEEESGERSYSRSQKPDQAFQSESERIHGQSQEVPHRNKDTGEK